MAVLAQDHDPHPLSSFQTDGREQGQHTQDSPWDSTDEGLEPPSWVKRMLCAGQPTATAWLLVSGAHDKGRTHSQATATGGAQTSLVGPQRAFNILCNCCPCLRFWKVYVKVQISGFSCKDPATMGRLACANCGTSCARTASFSGECPVGPTPARSMGEAGRVPFKEGVGEVQSLSGI